MEYNSQPPNRIDNVSSFIRSVNAEISKHKDTSSLFLYRGECRRYPSYCQPNIFRKNILSTNPYYEKGLFNTMRQSKLTGNTTYLENAIDAQHGEFPSRLLDVSYNCLMALYFAVTPYYHIAMTEYDTQSKKDGEDNDGMVYIFYINEIFSPSAENTNDNYNAIINKDHPWFSNHAIFQKNHKFIDHTKLNHRIIAQQGAFILFQGNDAEQIPAYMMSEIRIPCESKKVIRDELSMMFGINTASIYPEIVNAAEELVIKSQYLVTEPFCWENEIKYVLSNLQKEIEYYCFKFSTAKIEEGDPLYYQTVLMIEQVINSYRIGIIDFLNGLSISDMKIETSSKSTTEGGLLDIKKQYIRNFNSIIEYAINEFQNECQIELSDLSIQEDKGQ